MRLGFIGPAKSDAASLEQAAELLVTELEADIVIYLAEDDAFHEFIAATGSSDDIARLLQRLRDARYLRILRVAPPPPTRAMEMIDDRIVLVVRTKSTIAEEDVINSNLVVYGDAKQLTFKRFGPRCFFSPGPVAAGQVGLIDDQSEAGGVVLNAFDLSGELSWSEPIQNRGAKIMVAP